jgi:hypothetical protein
MAFTFPSYLELVFVFVMDDENFRKLTKLLSCPRGVSMVVIFVATPTQKKK